MDDRCDGQDTTLIGRRGLGRGLSAILPARPPGPSSVLRPGHERRPPAASRDPLTGLLTRNELIEDLDDVLARAAVDKSRTAVVVLGLDGFRHVNLAYGQHSGDLLLRRVGDHLAGARRSSDLVARIGGDEFAVVCPQVASETAARRVLDRLASEVEGPFLVGGVHHRLVATFGLVLTEPGGGELPGRTLVRRADLTMQRAKDTGAGVALFDDLGDRGHHRAFGHQQPRWNTSSGERRRRADERLGASSSPASPMSTAPR